MRRAIAEASAPDTSGWSRSRSCKFAGMSDVLRPALGLAPVACLLAVLVALDSYKLVSLTRVVAVLVSGAAMAGVSYAVNGALLENADIGFVAFTRYVAPIIEELLKAAIVVLL